MRTEQGQLIKLKDYRKPDYSVETVELIFKLDPEKTTVSSNMQVVRDKETAPGTILRFDGDELTLASLKINGKAAKAEAYTATSEELVLHKPPRTRRFTLEIETVVNPQSNTKLMGLYRSGGNYCTQCEAEGFRRITYFPDRPDVLAIYTTRIEANKKEAPILLGNGNPVESGNIDSDRHYSVWHDPHPKPSYLFALVGGDLESIHSDYVTGSGRPVKLAIYTEKGKSTSAEYAMDALIRSMRWDEEVFGREYDLDVFNIVAVSDFNMGAMENKGLNIFNDKYVLANPQTATDADYAGIERVIAHEYFHNWTGNRITCRDWFQLCLKEGLTVYRDQEFTADQRSRAVQRISEVRTLKAHQFVEDAGPLAHPVRPSQYREINNFYTATVYEKGAELVRMIVVLLGPAKFKKGMDLYFRRHDGEAATVEEFLKCFEDAGKADLSQFFNWYTQAGTPNLPVSASYDKVGRKLTLEIEQNLAATPGQSRKKLMHVPVRIGLISGKSGEIAPTKITGVAHEGDLFHLTRRQHKIVFHGVEERPAVSLNRAFTAPVNVDFSQSEADLRTLALNDSDPFNKWQAFQKLATQSILTGVRSIRRGKAPKANPRLGEIAAEIVGDETLEPAFRALMITLPGENEIAQTVARNVDPEAIFKALRFTLGELGAAIEPQRPTVTEENRPAAGFVASAAEAGKRSLINQMLSLGVLANSNNAEGESIGQFKNATNMNDRAAAFTRIVHLHGSRSQATKAIDAFSSEYGQDALVMDKWFSIQATAPGEKTLQVIRQLMQHASFSFSNPNRVRSLIGAFAMSNPTGFHAASGKGYALVSDVIEELDPINPQVAARLLTSFRSWKSLEEQRRKLAQTQLEKLAGRPNLSRDSADIIQRILGA
ncbi:MAG: aminopeptidase N [Pseudomonadota bacterium]